MSALKQESIDKELHRQLTHSFEYGDLFQEEAGKFYILSTLDSVYDRYEDKVKCTAKYVDFNEATLKDILEITLTEIKLMRKSIKDMFRNL